MFIENGITEKIYQDLQYKHNNEKYHVLCDIQLIRLLLYLYAVLNPQVFDTKLQNLTIDHLISRWYEKKHDLMIDLNYFFCIIFYLIISYIFSYSGFIW